MEKRINYQITERENLRYKRHKIQGRCKETIERGYITRKRTKDEYKCLKNK